MRSKSDTVSDICAALLAGKREDAASVARAEYPFTPFAEAKRAYTALQSTQIFRRDGFIDRYSGQRLVFPGTLRLLSILLPDEFPNHPNWKMASAHQVYWELFPTIDHVIPVARDGADDVTNWVTTSMVRNSAKANFTLEVGLADVSNR